MDKNAIKKYAVWARSELKERVSQKALQYGITENGKADPTAESVDGRLLSDAEKKQRKALIDKVNEQGYDHTIDEVAYTWFNRFAALRFMEINGYLPSHVRVFTNDAGEFKPQILSEAIHLDLEGIDIEKVYELKNANKDDELFKYLLIVQCNALNKILPCMFQRLEDYTELLLPDHLLREGSVIQQTIELIPEDDWTDQVQIIGWLYQYYNTEPKDKVFAELKKNVKIAKDKIPAATQLFTPDWIVQYMVENSLGRLWLEGHPNADLKSKWKYYLDEAEQEPDVQQQLEAIRKEHADLKPEDIRCIDPCMGSGHILCYMFDVLVAIYGDYGYSPREAVQGIINYNLYGLELDKRAYQLAYFAVMMKARQYDSRLWKRIEDGEFDARLPHLSHFQDMPTADYSIFDEPVKSFAEQFKNADTYGSLITVQADYNIDEILDSFHGTIEFDLEKMDHLVRLYKILSQRYDVVCTNPPYMAVSNAEATLQDCVKANYPDSKSDMFAVFIERCRQFIKRNGYQAMITQHAWMFLSSYEKLREKMSLVDTINMAHLGARAFDEIGGEVVQTTSFVLRGSHIKDYSGTYCRLIEPTTQQGKEDMFLAGENRYTANQENFSKIPGNPVAYWANSSIINAFSREKLIGELAEVKIGMGTGKNEIFVRQWWEILYSQIDFSLCDITELYKSKGKWFPYNKGGDYRLWYGNLQEVLWFDNQGRTKMNTMSGHRENGGMNYYFKKGITWTFISSSNFGVRQRPCGSLFDVAGSTLFTSEDNYNYLLAFLSSNVCNYILQMLNPTLNYQAGNIKNLPVVFGKKDKVRNLAQDNVYISRTDWDSFETSWDFKKHPLVPMAYKREEQLAAGMNSEERTKSVTLLSERYRRWAQECDDRFNQLKANEEELNRIFIDIYGLQDELTPDVDDKDVTVRKADLGRDIRSFISYSVGCMFGRYSIYKEGLLFAGEPYSVQAFVDKMNECPGTISESELIRAYTHEGVIVSEMFAPAPDNIIPICDDEYFSNDIVVRFGEFVETVFGKETLQENLRFIAEALGGKGSPKEVIRNYFLNDFYNDHCKIYQKRPIYWLFDSGKKNGFKCLVYMHRYKPDTIARIRTDYVHEQQSRYRAVIADLEQRKNGASGSERVKLEKQLSAIRAQSDEIREYEEKIHHLADRMISIDLDDGVKHNYEIFKDVLAKIK